MMSFAEFWPLYLRAHSRPTTRALHYAATALGLFTSGVGIVLLEAGVLIAGIAGSYALAIAAHWIFERNQPMIPVNPVWGAVADLRMTWLATTGRLAPELARHGATGARLPARSGRAP
jgi:hypothetical protein